MPTHRRTSFLAVAVFLVALQAVPGYAEESFTAKCLGGHDGDSITVLSNDEHIKIRLDGIDAPELGQDFGQQGKDRSVRVRVRQGCPRCT